MSPPQSYLFQSSSVSSRSHSPTATSPPRAHHAIAQCSQQAHCSKVRMRDPCCKRGARVC
eukprot:1707898-Rhodomonas_salina.1